jgi:chromosomal replication initiation ATPase DnaA
MYLCRERLQLSYPEIGMVFGKDHSTVLGACQRMRSQLPGDAFLRGHLAALESLIARETA